ncbi:dTDP-4-dehydrorhamnose 3,5-epimerase family protein [Desulfovibrio sp. OttesenSCG-928-G11]|nr:dTDP-4-dehydrorhamnose 3,5-epimerase family protein [Desulfovibrio sp. OttesenSCG-928-G11]
MLNIPAGAHPGAIQGLWTHDLSVIDTAGGPVLHMLRADSPLFRDFGEIYFSVILPGAVKAWKCHGKQSQNFAAPHGLVEVVIYDSRPDSATMGAVERFIIGRPDHYMLLHIPPGVWYGFAGRSDYPCILANCVDIPHMPGDSLTLDMHDPSIPYVWEN